MIAFLLLNLLVWNLVLIYNGRLNIYSIWPFHLLLLNCHTSKIAFDECVCNWFIVSETSILVLAIRRSIFIRWWINLSFFIKALLYKFKFNDFVIFTVLQLILILFNNNFFIRAKILIFVIKLGFFKFFFKRGLYTTFILLNYV